MHNFPLHLPVYNNNQAEESPSCSSYSTLSILCRFQFPAKLLHNYPLFIIAGI